MNARSERMAKRFEVPMLVAALLVIPMLIIQESSWDEPWPTIASILNWVAWLAFLVEVVVMLVVAPDRKRWLREHPIDVFVTLLRATVGYGDVVPRTDGGRVIGMFVLLVGTGFLTLLIAAVVATAKGGRGRTAAAA
jgi:hypothetical protein